MAETKTIHLPDVGDFDEIEIIEVLVASGDEIEAEDSIIVLESDKATMEIPSPCAGKVKSVNVAVGDKISEGSEIATVETGDSDDESSDKEDKEDEDSSDKDEDSSDRDEDASDKDEDSSDRDEQPSDEDEDSSDKDKGSGDKEEESGGNEETGDKSRDSDDLGSDENSRSGKSSSNQSGGASSGSGKLIHASPSIRRYARELGVDLERVEGSGTKGRILKEDVKGFIKTTLTSGSAAGGLEVAAMPEIDFAKFGEIESVDLNRIKKKSGAHLHRSWITVPHVTQFDEAEITELESFRKSLAKEAEASGVKLTPLVFLMKAAVAALKSFPEVNASLDSSGEKLILKKYFHIGVAVDTPNGLVVPVIRDVDQKGLFDLAEELASTAERARKGKLSPGDMQGGCFSISSLGGIGGTHFTPIVNAPEVAILGVGKAKMQPVYKDDGSFRPGLILPLALSYDHRVIDGAQGARFVSDLSRIIADIRRVLI